MLFLIFKKLSFREDNSKHMPLTLKAELNPKAAKLD